MASVAGRVERRRASGKDPDVPIQSGEGGKEGNREKERERDAVKEYEPQGYEKDS